MDSKSIMEDKNLSIKIIHSNVSQYLYCITSNSVQNMHHTFMISIHFHRNRMQTFLELLYSLDFEIETNSIMCKFKLCQ